MQSTVLSLVTSTRSVEIVEQRAVSLVPSYFAARLNSASGEVQSTTTTDRWSAADKQSAGCRSAAESADCPPSAHNDERVTAATTMASTSTASKDLRDGLRLSSSKDPKT